MNEVKRPKKPLIFYYTLVMVALALFNFLLVPWIAEQQIIEVDYGTFITMTENKEIDQVKVEDNQILFEGKDGKVYKTGLMNDPDLVNRLHDSGAKFGGEIVEESSPLLNIALGQFMSKKLMDRAGGPNSMMFNGGNSNARVYVQSSDGIKFDDVEGVDEAEESLQEIVDKVTHKNIQSLLDTQRLLLLDELEQCVELIANARTVLLFGIGSSLCVAKDTYLKFLRLDKPCVVNEDSHSQLLQARNATAQDVGIVFSYSGQTMEMIQCIKEMKAGGAPVIAVTPPRWHSWPTMCCMSPPTRACSATVPCPPAFPS